MAATAVTTKKEDGLLKKIAKGATRLLGDGVGYVAGMAAIAGVIAFVGVYVVPAAFGILGTAIEGGSWLALGAKLLEPLPYFAAWIGGGAAASFAGIMAAEWAGGSRIAKGMDELEKKETARKSDAPLVEKPSTGLNKTAAPSFNSSSPRVDDSSNLALDIAVLTQVLPSLGR